jgi:Holliday junction resolvasome RuvABC endonuclease subunit
MATPPVIGLDLSITATGIADVDGSTSVVKTDSGHKDQRLNQIRDAVWSAIRTAPSGLFVVIEDLPTNAKAAGITGMVHGAIRLLLIDLTVPYVLVTAASLKKYATGNGGADKVKMGVAALKRFGREFGDDNQCDAFWLRAMALDAFGAPLVPMPAAQRATLAKVSWPEAVAAA